LAPAAVVVSGHMVDAPDRTPPRFPQQEVPRVAAEVRRTFERWGVGPGTTLVTGGARGADIVAAEEARARGARLKVVLASVPDEFVAESVALPGTDWEQRFRSLLDDADWEVVDPGDDVFVRTNERILEVARSLDERPHALIVWDGAKGDGPGGTADFASQLGQPGDDRVVVIAPMSG
jgi:hypothetical protein